MDDTSNPWSSPVDSQPAAKQGRTSAIDTDSIAAIAKQTFVVWEKLRVLYIAILAVVTLVCCLMNLPWRDPSLLLAIVPCAIAANLLYFAGPMVDTYIRWLGYRQAWPRQAMFWGGTTLSALAAVMVLRDLT